MEREEQNMREIVTLTPKEKAAVDAFIAAAKALPPSICIDVVAPWDNEPNLTVSKRTSPCTARQVASLRKESLYF